MLRAARRPAPYARTCSGSDRGCSAGHKEGYGSHRRHTQEQSRGASMMAPHSAAQTRPPQSSPSQSISARDSRSSTVSRGARRDGSDRSRDSHSRPTSRRSPVKKVSSARPAFYQDVYAYPLESAKQSTPDERPDVFATSHSRGLSAQSRESSLSRSESKAAAVRPRTPDKYGSRLELQAWVDARVALGTVGFALGRCVVNHAYLDCVYPGLQDAIVEELRAYLETRAIPAH